MLLLRPMSHEVLLISQRIESLMCLALAEVQPWQTQQFRKWTSASKRSCRYVCAHPCKLKVYRGILLVLIETALHPLEDCKGMIATRIRIILLFMIKEEANFDLKQEMINILPFHLSDSMVIILYTLITT